MKADLFSALVAASLTSAPGPAGAAPIELGRVAWGRDVDAGFAAARRTGRPVLVLFQEIPGCNELLPRRDGIWSEPAVAQRLVDALAAAGREVPPYLALAADELQVSNADLAAGHDPQRWLSPRQRQALDGKSVAERN